MDLCVCGMTTSIMVQESDMECNVDCSVLNPTSKCGGNESFAIYRAGQSSFVINK